VIDPLAAGITSIGLDHQEYLGNTEAAIASEKAGIFKKGKPGVIGPLTREAYESVYRVAQAVGSPVIEASQLYRTSNVELSLEGTSFDLSHTDETIRVTTGLIGYAQAANTSVALAILAAAGDKWRGSLTDARRILPTIRLAGRFQRVGNVILDVAHNGDGIRSVVATLQQLDVPRPITTVLGVLADKDWQTMIRELANITDRLVIVAPPSAPHARAWDPPVALQFALEAGINAVLEPDFESAMKDASELPGTVLVTGSFHTVGDALLSLGQKTL
jgi:dihydrofolate synthase / folylpolyglutamate synthase